MRIPVHPEDLTSNRGFKSMAKQLRKILHGPTRIQLAFAQDVLAKGFGYENYHDLEKTAQAATTAVTAMEHSTARQVILSGLQAALAHGDVSVSDEELQGLIRSLPLNSLTAFRRTPARPSSARQGLTKASVKAIGRVANASGSLRDKALFACMQAGVRPMEYCSAIYLNRIGVYQRAKAEFGHTPLPNSCQVAIKKYARVTKLSKGDFLFPSAEDSRRPMSAYELNKLLRAWARSAGIEDGVVTAHGIRTVTVAYEVNMLARIRELTGHFPIRSTLNYIDRSLLPLQRD
ncbi:MULTISPECIES: tyrosine-type recombinase/integrase [Pseudomonas]|uniref:Tyrosine-type recombinase/integrase n=1 Tax=Pseudomonas taiwanensis TaxID=470150 RepID=A0A7L9GK25_9PSED|nr:MULTISPECIES: tyrosine-type recombinase/integrase [Pseudomonas]QOJ92781.1 tyrosine-type recombinase/integrase [Pseudomonas taiwanensis]WQQ36789.1 tyrosine-type recombinase/integrase [Pseudomonas putida]